jgi:hypothetical protein
MTVKTVTLASGHKMPLVGFGLWKVPADKAADIVYNVSDDSLGRLISEMPWRASFPNSLPSIGRHVHD